MKAKMHSKCNQSYVTTKYRKTQPKIKLEKFQIIKMVQLIEHLTFT